MTRILVALGWAVVFTWGLWIAAYDLGMAYGIFTFASQWVHYLFFQAMTR